MSLEGLELGILGPAFLAGLLVLSTHVPLGYEVLARGIIFIDLAIAQVAGLGVIAADSFGWEPHGVQVQAAAVSAALLGAALLNWSERRWPEIQEPLIGVSFVLAATGGILLLAGNPHGGEHLRELLVGQLLWVNPARLVPVAVLYVGVLGAWFGLRDRIGRAGFYALFAISVTASVQLVGIYLVFASLVIPALGTRALTGRSRLIAGYVLGAVGYVAGLVLSALLDLPSGGVVVWTLAVFATLTAWGTAVRARGRDRGRYPHRAGERSG